MCICVLVCLCWCVCINSCFHLYMSCKLRAIYFLIYLAISLSLKYISWAYFQTIIYFSIILFLISYIIPLCDRTTFIQSQWCYHGRFVCFFHWCISKKPCNGICKLLLIYVPLVIWSEKLIIKSCTFLFLFKMYCIWPLKKVVPIYTPSVLWKHFCFSPNLDNTDS